MALHLSQVPHCPTKQQGSQTLGPQACSTSTPQANLTASGAWRENPMLAISDQEKAVFLQS